MSAYRIEQRHLTHQAGVVHGKLQAEFVQPHARTGALAVKRQRHFGRIRQIECQVVRPLGAHARARRKHALGRFPKRNRDDALPFGQAFAGAQEKRPTRPAPVVNETLQGNRGLGFGLGVYPFFAAVG